MTEMDDDIEFEKLLEDKRHKEILGLFKQLISAIKDEGKDSELIKLISKSNGNIDVFLEKIKEVSAAKSGDVTVNVDTEKIITTVTDSKKELLTALNRQNELLEQLIMLRGAEVVMEATDWGYGGSIKKVKVTPVIPKSKYNA